MRPARDAASADEVNGYCTAEALGSLGYNYVFLLLFSLLRRLVDGQGGRRFDSCGGFERIGIG
ncbi:MAG: hypothetical protein BWY17_02226 [Deltaproteobacteria bacterium ADurb.Bin207]|jgi:hypothetical protein|nr:MAG: hypothetical protein BWY17_02226 [Deltaproteobacteria bacterium ADurb.Bin207]